MSEKNLSTVYDPKQVEDRLYDFWVKNNYFHGEVDNTGEKEPFCIVIPPPNVTSHLHIGHALDNTLQDILVRFNRMKGRTLPGYLAQTTPVLRPRSKLKRLCGKREPHPSRSREKSS